jgi:hypothetical protein
VCDNLETLYGAVDDGALDVRLPKHAREELDAHLASGLLCRGFARIRCGTCEEPKERSFTYAPANHAAVIVLNAALTAWSRGWPSGRFIARTHLTIPVASCPIRRRLRHPASAVIANRPAAEQRSRSW